MNLIPRPAGPALSHVIHFCAQVAPGQTPVVVQCRPIADMPEPSDSVDAVRGHVVSHGGEQVDGWVIRETQGLFLEAEPYSIWRDSEGNLLDVFPQKPATGTSLFIRDDKRPHRGPLLDTIRRPLVDDVNVTRFLYALQKHASLSHQLDQAENQGKESKADRIERDLVKLEKDLDQLYTRLLRLV